MPKVGRPWTRAVCATAVAVTTLVPVLGGHHLITEVYDVSRTTTIEGHVDALVLTDPHAFVHLSVVGVEGQERIWAVELEGASVLRRSGIGAKTLARGDRLAVCGHPGRDASQYRLLMLELRRPADGVSVSRHVPEGGAVCRE